MPLYEYQCQQCGNRFELIRKFSDPPVETCPKCGGPVEKLIAAPAFQLKGTGWYITDYARKDSSGKSESGSKDSSKGSADQSSAGSSNTQSDSKKDSKTESTSESKTESKKESSKDDGKPSAAGSSSDSGAASKT